jgi:hypothetical protein
MVLVHRVVNFLSRRRLPLPAAMVISIAALIFGGGVAYAAHQIISPDPVTHVIHACYNNNSGTIKLVNTGQQCHQNETAIQWNQVGAQGIPGPAGPAGPSGLSGWEQDAHQVFVSPGATTNVTVMCPAGKKILGGGFDIETPDDLKVFASEPALNGNLINGWNVLVHNISTVNTRQTTVTAICA